MQPVESPCQVLQFSSLITLLSVLLLSSINSSPTRVRARAGELTHPHVASALQAAKLLPLCRLALARFTRAQGGGAKRLAGARQGAPLGFTETRGLHNLQKEAARSSRDYLDVRDVGRHFEVGREDQAVPGEAVVPAGVSGCG